ncbi:TPA: hypothetical protein DEP26_04440 [Candidatus Uhrbacteria bacterium]|nr:MAG: hypothetical protein UT94_C0002G0034 [Candidatus Uhrbacteria bacterium GW2011_GWF2_40_263]OGL97382.1 MAG: hypothetical protein A2332_04655 [Candidatus Uhrbacteria bacterium RIFOXYB2_FULL_41_18]HCB56182.1 hypothetical protein [Candidatus Uhrbacteria bacterium]
MSMTNRLDPDSFWRTSDLSLSALVLLYRPLEAIEKQPDQRKADFLYAHDAELDDLVERFWRGEVRVDPRQYFTALREIKARLYEN